MKICSTCGSEKEFTEFYRRANAKDGYQSSCKSCMGSTYQKCRSAKVDHYKATQQSRYDHIRNQFREWKRSKGCLCCSETEPVCLALHHLDASKKEYAPSDLLTYSWNKLMEEASKCVVVCANCHAKIHAGIIQHDKHGNPMLL